MSISDDEVEAAVMAWNSSDGITLHSIMRAALTAAAKVRANSEGDGEVWFAVQSVTGTHIGMWKDEGIARSVFRQEYPDGTFLALASIPATGGEKV